MWQAVLTLVLMNPRKNKGGKKVRRLIPRSVLRLLTGSCSVWHVRSEQLSVHAPRMRETWIGARLPLEFPCSKPGQAR